MLPERFPSLHTSLVICAKHKQRSLGTTVDPDHSNYSVVADAPLRPRLSQTLHAVDEPAAATAGLALIEAGVGTFVGEPPLQTGILLGAAGRTGSCTCGAT